MTDQKFHYYIRKSPYFEATQRHGCQSYDVYNHMYLPEYYNDPVDEYWKLVNDVTLWDVAAQRQVEITGPNGFAFTNLLTPRDLTRCKVGQGKYVVITTEDGGIVNDPVLLRLGENHFWLSAADSDLLLWVKGVAVNSGMDVTVREPDVSPLQVQGPKSPPVVQALFGDRALALRYYEFMETALGDIPVVVTRTGWTGEVGYEIYLCDHRRGDELWEAVMRAGKSHDMAVTGPSGIRQVEAGILNYGSDMTLEDNPYEVGLRRLVDLEKESDFIGKEALKRIGAEGVKRSLVGVEFVDERLPAGNEDRWPVKRDGEQVGCVTVAVYSPRLERNIGYAWVPIGCSEPGTALTVETPWGEATAQVARRPFIDPEKKTPVSRVA